MNFTPQPASRPQAALGPGAMSKIAALHDLRLRASLIFSAAKIEESMGPKPAKETRYAGREPHSSALRIAHLVKLPAGMS